MPEAQAEHRWLQRLVGEWSYVTDMEGVPGEGNLQDAGTERVRSLGDLWALFEGESEDGTSTTLMTLGYDPEKRRFVGTYVGTMMTTLWLYDGELEPGDTRLALYSDGPSFTEAGKTSRYRDTMELLGDDERVVTSEYQQADGTWKAFMVSRYRRVD